MMDTTNGTSTPPITQDFLSAMTVAAATPSATAASVPPSDLINNNKRKRSESASQPPLPPSTLTKSTPTTATSPLKNAIPIRSKALFLDILEVFKRYDTTPSSILEHALPDPAQSDPHSAKRVKLADGDNGHHHLNDDTTTSISSKIHRDAYNSLDELQQDILDVCAAIIEPIKTKERQRNGARLPSEDIKTMQRVMAFQHLATAALTREAKKGHQDKPASVKNEIVQNGKHLGNKAGKTVLTLFGNAPTPRQLFSSFQHPAAAQHVKADGADLDLEEHGLPNMLNATKVMPLDPDTALGARPKEPTFADIFTPPATLLPLNPPKPKSTTRSTTISWVTGESLLPKPSRKNAYPMQPLNVGSWIEYSGRDRERDSPSTIKRRRRESVVSVVPTSKPVEEMSPADIMAQEQALFKAAYSSFAPTVDNSKAIVPDEIRDRVWWHKVGQKRFDKRFVLDPALETSFPLPANTDEDSMDQSTTLGSVDEMKELEEAIENFDEAAFNADSLVSTINDNEERTAEEMLKDISGLLETLSSYQRIRNSFIVPASSRNPTSPSPSLMSTMGTPTEPTKEETAIYKALRSQLAQMIDRLPPYAVAKLDGQQLEDLAVSKTIIIEGKEVKGTMEEDQLTRMIRSSAAMQAAAGSTPAPRAPATDYKSISYGRTPSTAQPSRSAHAPNPSYYSNARTPATSFNRSTVAQAYNTPSATVSRPSYGQVPAYPPSTVPRQSSYGQTNGQSGYRSGYNYNSTFSAQPTPQQQTQTTGGYNTQQNQFRGSTAFNQNASVGTPSYNAQPASHARQGYSAAATQFMQQRPSSQSQQQPNSGRATPVGTNPQTPSVLGPSGFHTSMTSEQQRLMMERQRAQLAQQPAARAQAQADIQRVAAATPQPTQSLAHPPPPQPRTQHQQQQQNGDSNRGSGETPVVV